MNARESLLQLREYVVWTCPDCGSQVEPLPDDGEGMEPRYVCRYEFHHARPETYLSDPVRTVVFGQWTRDDAVKAVQEALGGDSWECRGDDLDPIMSWIERGTGEDTERFISVPINYADACKIESLLAVARGD